MAHFPSYFGMETYMDFTRELGSVELDDRFHGLLFRRRCTYTSLGDLHSIVDVRLITLDNSKRQLSPHPCCHCYYSFPSRAGHTSNITTTLLNTWLLRLEKTPPSRNSPDWQPESHAGDRCLLSAAPSWVPSLSSSSSRTVTSTSLLHQL